MGAPLFSVVVPTFRRPERLAACLGALAALGSERDRYEVVVVDDAAGAVPLDAVLQPFRERLDLVLVTPAHGGPAAARNAGAARARGELLAFTDDDCLPTPGWLSAFAEAFAGHPQALLGGRTVNALPERTCSSASQLLIDYLYAHYNADPRHARFLASSNLAVRADAFRSAGGFDVQFPGAAAEDRELCDRWSWQGRPMVYVPDAVVAHAHALTLAGFWRQHASYGRGAYRFHAIRARRGNERIRVEPPSFYWNLLRYPFVRERGARALSIAALFALSQLANTAGFATARLRDYSARHQGQAAPRRSA